mgnify:CR=1 FL=1
MFGRTLMTLGLAMLLAAPAHAGFGLVLPDSPIVDDPEKTSLNLVICAIDPATARASLLTPASLHGTALQRRQHGPERTPLRPRRSRRLRCSRMDHKHFPAPPRVYQLVMQTKAGWVPEQDKFVQYVTKVQIPAYGPPKAGTSPPTSALRSRP